MDGAAIAKLLASPHRSTRDRAVRALSAWLSSDGSVPDAELMKAWKGIFYCFWHCDGAAAQSALAARVAALLSALPPSLSARFLAAAFATLRREWPGVDLLRLDKFYLLLRRILRHLFLLLKSNSWNHELSAQFLGILFEKSLLSADKCPSQGINYHVAGSFLDELKDFLPLSVKTLEILLSPFITVLEKSPDKVLVNKVKLNVFDRLLENGSNLLSVLRAGEEVEEGGEVEKFGKVGLLLSLAKKFFESASGEETIQGNRKVLFALHEGFLKLEKDLEKSGVEVLLPELENGILEKVDGDVGTESIGHGDGEQGNDSVGSNGKPSKKRKKTKEALILENMEEGEADVPSDGNASERTKKKKKSKKELDGIEKKGKAKKKKKKKLSLVVDNVIAESISEADSVANGKSVDWEVKEADDSINFDETVLSNLQKQFEKVAAEVGMANGGVSLSNGSMSLAVDQAIPIIGTVLKKRKRSKSLDGKVKLGLVDASGVINAGKSGEKSVKKVTFSMKNNLVWKPHSPLPPQSLRLPPSTTPRGSALKQGVPPGPIKETPPTVKKVKVKASSAKKALKSSRTASPAVKRLRKLQNLSVN